MLTRPFVCIAFLLGAVLSAQVSAQTVPDAPTGAIATAGDTEADVAFTVPASDGGSAITGYTATSAPGGLTSTGCTASPCTVTGLANGTEYTFTVTATNAVGTSGDSAASNAVTPNVAPGAPVIGLATAGDGAATVAFTAPAGNGGTDVTGYTATILPDNAPFDCALNIPCTVTGLTNGTEYTFTISATNAAGTGDASAESNPVIPSGTSIADIVDASPPTLSSGMIACIKGAYPDQTRAFTDVRVLVCPTGDPGVDSFVGIQQFSELGELRVVSQSISSSSALTSLGFLPKLKILDLSSNLLTDDDAEAIEALTGLEQLLLSDNGFTVLPSLAGFSALTHLQLAQNQLTLAGIAGLVDVAPTLESLNLWANQIDGELGLGSGLAQLAQLEVLNVGDNMITAIPALASLDNLKTLFIENFDPAVPNNTIDSLEPLANAGADDPLEFVFAGGNALASADGLGNKPNLTLAYLNDNQITQVFALNEGADPLPSMVELDLSSNYLQGFYEELKSLPASSFVYLFDNPLICSDLAGYESDQTLVDPTQGFQPTAIFEQQAPFEPGSTVCTLDADLDRFGAFNTSVAAPAAAFDKFPDEILFSKDTDDDAAPDGFNPGRSDPARESEIDAFPTDPAASVDTDEDGFPDAWNAGESEGTSTTGLQLDAFPDDAAAWEDTDGDGCPNELFGVSTSNPPLIEDALPLRSADCIDADMDGIGPNEELANGTTDNNPDFDSDGLLDGEEVITYLTDPTDPDSDGDEFSDGDEVDFGSDPNDPDDVPVSTGLNIPLIYEALKQSAPADP